jgi:hypothetical protein
MLKIALGIFLMAHGAVHAILAVAPNPGEEEARPGAFFTAVDRSWLLPQLGLDAGVIRWIGIILVALSALGFILAGLGVLGVPGLSAVWRSVAIGSSCLSLLLLILFWYPWLIVGVAIDIAVLLMLIWAKWPTVELIGS